MNDSKRTPYSSPKLERFGTLRELTRLGSMSSDDFLVGFGVPGPTGCNPDDNSKYGCGRS